MPITHASGTKVHYAIAGNGPGLVLVHGTSLDAAANYGHLVEQFAGERTVITPDYAGSGETTAPSGDLMLDLLVEQAPWWRPASRLAGPSSYDASCSSPAGRTAKTLGSDWGSTPGPTPWTSRQGWHQRWRR